MMPVYLPTDELSTMTLPGKPVMMTCTARRSAFIQISHGVFGGYCRKPGLALRSSRSSVCSHGVILSHVLPDGSTLLTTLACQAPEEERVTSDSSAPILIRSPARQYSSVAGTQSDTSAPPWQFSAWQYTFSVREHTHSSCIRAYHSGDCRPIFACSSCIRVSASACA